MEFHIFEGLYYKYQSALSTLAGIIGYLNFSSTFSTGSPKAVVFGTKLSEYSEIPKFVIAFRNYLLSLLAKSRSSEITSLLLCLLLFWSYHYALNVTS